MARGVPQHGSGARGASARQPALVAALVLAAAALPVPAQQPGGPEIVNVADCAYLAEFVPPGGGQGSTLPFTVLSNRVVTPIGPAACPGLPPRLGVEPAGTVAPGAALTYTLTLLNDSGSPLQAVEVALPLDPRLEDPSFYSLPPGVDGRFDAPTRTVRWDVPNVGVGQRLELETRTRVRADTPAESVIATTATVDAAGCSASVDSNTVETGVVPPVLRVLKTADRSTAAPGDSVVYEIEVRHEGTEPDLAAVRVDDLLPEGFRYVEGSLRLDGDPVADPHISAGGERLALDIGPLAPGQTRRLALAARVTPLAPKGEAANLASAVGTTAAGLPFRSPESTAVVEVVDGPFRSEAFLVGRVFVDRDGDGLPDPGEPGVPGVLVLLENGRGAVSDITGRWHVEGVRPGLRALRLDPATLPAGLEPLAAGAEWAGNPHTRFLEARAATLVVADFPLGPADSPGCTVIAGRVALALPRASLLVPDDEPAAAAAAHLESVAAYLAGRGRAASGAPQLACDGDGGGGSMRVPGLERSLRRRLEQLTHERRPEAKVSVARVDAGRDPAMSRSPMAPDPFGDLLREVSVEPAIVSPADGERVRAGAVDVDVVFPAGSMPELRVNGETVPGERIGVRSLLPARGVAAARYVAVRLRPGVNELTFVAGSGAGAAEPVRVRVTRPGAPVGLRLEVPEGRWLADGVTPGELRIEAVDAGGFRTTEQTVVTLWPEKTRPLDPDLDPQTDGHQLRLVDGRALVRFAPAAVPGRARVLASIEHAEEEIFIDVLPKAGDWMVLGLAEGRLAGDGGLDGDGGVDEPIHGDGGRLAVFARGPVGKASQLTLSIDSERERDRDRLYRDFEPDTFYPVPGDSGTGLDEAAAQGEVFARIDGPIGFAQWGDFDSGLERTELMRYQRRLNGASGRVRHRGVGFDGFAASTRQQAVRDVFEPDGSSGPFLLRAAPLVARSETVYVETRERHRTERVLARTIRRADVDYTLDPVAGTLLFRAPVEPFDADLNPQRIVVLYESRTSDTSQLSAGGRLSLSPGPELEGGLSTVYEQRAGDDLTMVGVDLSWRPAPGTRLRGEVATSDLGNSANAFALEVASRPSPRLAWEVAYQNLDAGFANPSLLGSPELGSRRAGGSVLWEPNGSWRLHGEAFRQQDDLLDLDRRVAALDAERRFGRLDVFGGLKAVSSEGAAGEISSSLAGAGVRGRIGERWLAEVGRDQVVGGGTAPGYPTRTAAALSYALRPGTKLFLRHELESGDGPERDRTRLGVESRIGAHTKALAGYALEGGVSGSALRSTAGVETALPLSHRSALSLSLARLDTMDGDASADYTTLAGGYEYRAGSSLLSGRYEVRLGESADRHLLTAAGAFKPVDRWTLFVRERLFLTDPESGRSGHRVEGLLGAAYRPAGHGFRFLWRLDHSIGGGRAAGPGGIGTGALSQPAGARSSPSPSAAPGLGLGPGREAAVVDRDIWSMSLAFGSRLTARQRLAGSIVGRAVEGDVSIGLPSTRTYLLSLHHTADIRRRWTLGWSARRFAQEETGTALYGYGAEVGFLVLRDLWLTGGYNLAGFEDRRFPGVDTTAKGPFFSVRVKFDERSLERLGDLRLDRR